MIVLRSDDLLVRADPRHGGEILDLVDVRSGAQYLGRPPFAPQAPLAGDLDEDTWTDRYRGGWQVVAPNAGNACTVDGVDHGFHGAASVGAWDVTTSAADAATLAWSGHGLSVSRRLRIQDSTLEIDTAWRPAAAAPVPLVWVEHFTVGVHVLSPEVEVTLAGGRGFELSETDGPVRPPDAAPAWPEILLLDGSLERADRWPIAQARARFCCVADLPAGRLEVRNAATGQGLALEWDVEVLPHLWIWHEVRTSGGRWRGQAEMLGLEPASIPHSLGLARALSEGQAHVLEPDGELTCRMAVRLLDGASAS